MSMEDPNKIDVSEQQPSMTDNVESSELSEDELKTVSGGVRKSAGGSQSGTIDG